MPHKHFLTFACKVTMDEVLRSELTLESPTKVPTEACKTTIAQLLAVARLEKMIVVLNHCCTELSAPAPKTHLLVHY